MTVFLRRYAAPLFFALYLLAGFILTPDYGVGWDEARQRDLGVTVFDYINERFGEPFYEGSRVETRLPELDNRDHGSLFQTIAYSIEFGFQIDDYRQQYLLRHYLSFLIFYAGVLAFYGLLKLQWNDSLPALAGVALLLLQPRIFAHSFNNPKDTIFLAFFTIAMYAMARWLQHKSIWRSVLLGLACGALMNVRILAILVPAILFGFIGLEWWKNNFSVSYLKKLSLPLFIYLLSYLFFTVMLGPYLWEDPVGNFMYTLHSLSDYSWGGAMLYWHEWVWATDRPWHYPIAWMMITTPLFILLLFLFGSYQAVGQLIRQRFYQNEADRMLLMSIVWFFGPLLAVILKGSTLYDGWRHLFFLAPAMSMLAVYGGVRLHEQLSVRARQWGVALLVISSLYTLGLMVRHHPNQQVYFNWTVGKSITERFEMDYYGAAYEEALRQLADRLPTEEKVKIYSPNWPGRANYFFLPADVKDRFEQVYQFNQADFFLSNYRYQHEWGKWYKQEHPYDHPFFELSFRSNPYVGVYDLRN